ncbi:MAG: type II toxin-antitoxin system RelE/ParE family toxin [Cocleimonas sp.]
MLPIIVLPQADSDIDTFFFYIAEDDVAVADKFLERVEETQKLIANFPKIAPMFITENPALSGIRWFPVKNFPKHLLFYIEGESRISIVRMLHKAQDISNILQ